MPSPTRPLPTSRAAALTGPVYGLDIETDTTVDGLDPLVARVVAIAISTEDGEHVFDGAELDILRATDHTLATLEPGVLVTWYGSGFDLPFLEHRISRHGLLTGLRVLPAEHDPQARVGSWHRHRHLDAYRVYRNDLPRLLPVSCSLKSVARLLGFEPIEVDIERLHELPANQLRDYVASDARLGRAAALRRWTTAAPFMDQLVA